MIQRKLCLQLAKSVHITSVRVSFIATQMTKKKIKREKNILKFRVCVVLSPTFFYANINVYIYTTHWTNNNNQKDESVLLNFSRSSETFQMKQIIFHHSIYDVLDRVRKFYFPTFYDYKKNHFSSKCCV